jgi:hypothetical protein
MRFYPVNDERVSFGNRIFRRDPCTAYVLNGALTEGGYFFPPGGSATADNQGMAVRKALAEMVERRALAAHGVGKAVSV